MYATSPEQSRRARVQALAAQLHRERYHYLLRIARKHAANDSEAEDAVQEAFAQFISAYRPDSGSPPLAWLTIVMQRLCWAARKRSRVIRITPTGQDGPEGVATPDTAGPGAVEDTVERSERTRELGRQIARLKPAERRALSLLACGYSYADIGELTGFSRTKVNRSLAEGRAALRQAAGA
jgi:RNA polymerase sigma factor (sigma-70 family)